MTLAAVRRELLTSALLVMAVASGCGVKPVPTEGVVSLDGKPVEGASVVFLPEDDKKGMAAHGSSRADGRFQLHTLNQEGALPGRYRVLVTKFDSSNTKKNKDESKVESAATLLPVRYATEKTSPLRCEIPASGTVALELTSAEK